MLAILIGTLFGFLSGVFTLLFFSYIVVMRDRKKVKNEANIVKAKNEIAKLKYEAARPRLKQAAEISNRQLDLYAQIQNPSSNSLHSKYKNELVAEIKLLEKEKRSILRSIIKEGLDPELSLTDEMTGKKEIIKLSDYMNRNGISLNEVDDKPATPARAGKPTKNSKFYIIDGGKSDVSH